MKKLHQAAGANNFSAITNSNNTGFCKQMGKTFWGLEVIWFLHNCFVKIGWVKNKFWAWDFLAYPCPPLVQNCWSKELLVSQVSKLLLVTSCQSPSWKPFQMNRDWSAGGLLRCDTRIQLNMVWGTRKVSNTIKKIQHKWQEFSPYL